MPNVGSIGWVNLQGATTPLVNHNASTISVKTTIPADHYAILYGPITVGAGIEFTIGADAQVKIKDFDDV